MRDDAARRVSESSLKSSPTPFLREVFRAYIHAKQHRRGSSFKSYREIAAELGGARGHTTIRNWIRRDFLSIFQAMGGDGEPSAEKHDVNPPDVSLADVVRAALKEARTAMPAVMEPYDRGEIVRTLEEMLEEARSLPWRPPEERPPDPTAF